MYTLHFPFQLPDGQAFEVDEQKHKIDDLLFSFTKVETIYGVNVQGFPTTEEAEKFIPKIIRAMQLILLNHNYAPFAYFDSQKIQEIARKNKKDSKEADEDLVLILSEADGLIDGSRITIFPTTEKIVKLFAGSIEVTRSVHSDGVILWLRQALEANTSPGKQFDNKVNVALDLYSAYSREISSNARFLTLMMVLEALTVPTLRPASLTGLIEKWQNEVDILKSTASNSDEIEAFEALSKQISYLKDNSITTQIRELVFESYLSEGEDIARSMSKAVRNLYAIRSKLVHQGKVDVQKLSKAIEEAKSIVIKVLKHKTGI